MALTIGHIAYNSKDLEPLGFIDPIIRNVDPLDMPKGTYSWGWGPSEGTFITSWGAEFYLGEFTYSSVNDDLSASGDPTIYVVLFSFIYYDIEGVELAKRTRVVRLIVDTIPPGVEEADLPQDSLNTYYLFPDSETRNYISFEVRGTLQLDPDSPLASQIVGLQYDDAPVFGRNNLRLLPSDRLGIQLFWANNVMQPSPQGNIPGSGTSLGGIGGGLMGSLIGGATQLIDLAFSQNDVSIAFQLVNSKTIVDRKVVVTQAMLDTPRIDGYMPVKLTADDEGIMKVLCACDIPLDLNATELENLGTNPPTSTIEANNNRLGWGAGEEGVVWNQRLKQIYRSDYVGQMDVVCQSTPNNRMEDLIANTILVNSFNEDDDESEIEAGHELYITYTHVFDFHLRQHVEVHQGFHSMFIGGFAMNFELAYQRTDVYSWLPSTFWVAKDQTEAYLSGGDTQSAGQQGGGDGGDGGVGGLGGGGGDGGDEGTSPPPYMPFALPGINPFAPRLPNANWSNYIEDKELLKQAAEDGVPSSQVETQLIKYFGHRQINSMRGNMATNVPFPNGIIVGTHTYEGGNPGGILWIDPFYNARVLIPRDQIRDQEWWNEWFVEKVMSERINGTDLDVDAFADWDRNSWDVFFDQNIFVNSFLTDNQKLAYDDFTAEAFNNCSEFDINDDTESTGIGFANLDFYIPGKLDSRVTGLPEMDSEYYSDASSSFFVTPPRMSPSPGVWDPIMIQSLPGNFGGTATVTQQATYLYFQPLSLDLNGRIYFEVKPPVLINQPFICRVVTRPSATNVTGTNVNFDRTKGLYCTPDNDGVHSRMFVTDSSVLNDVYSMNIIQSGFSHDDVEESAVYANLYSFRGLVGDNIIYSKGIRVVPRPAPENTNSILDVNIPKGSGGFELELPGYVERIVLFYEIDDSDINQAYLTLSIIGDSSETEIIDIIGLSSAGYTEIYLGYANGSIIITSNMEDSIDSMKAHIFYIDEDEMERITKESTSSFPLIDEAGNYNIFELLSENSKTNMSLMRSGNMHGPYFVFPYIFPSIGNDVISNLFVRNDFKNSYAYVFFVLDGSLLVKRVSYSDLDVAQISSIDEGFFEDGIDESAFVYAGYADSEYPLLSYNYLLGKFNQCRQMANLYFEPSYLIQSDVIDNSWLNEEMLSYAVSSAYSVGSSNIGSYDFTNLSDDDEYTSRVVVTQPVFNAYLSNDSDYLESNGYSFPVDGGFTAEILSNGNLVVFYTHEGRVYGRISSGLNDWAPLFNINGKVSGFKPVRVSKLSPQEVGFPLSTNMDDITIEDLTEDELDIDLSFDSFDVSSISSCYDPKSDSLYLFYVLDGFLAFNKISGMSLVGDSGLGAFYKLDSTTPRSILKSSIYEYPSFLVGSFPDGLSDAISIEGNNYLQFKYSIDSIDKFQTDDLSVQESPVSAFILNNGIVRFMYSDSDGGLRGGVLSGLRPELDVQLRKNV